MRPVGPAHQHHQLDQLVPHKLSEGGELGHKEVHEELSDLEPIGSGNGHPLESDDILRYQTKSPITPKVLLLGIWEIFSRGNRQNLEAILSLSDTDIILIV